MSSYVNTTNIFLPGCLQPFYCRTYAFTYVILGISDAYHDCMGTLMILRKSFVILQKKIRFYHTIIFILNERK